MLHAQILQETVPLWPLEGLHHITAITADAPRNVDFYARLLGLRLVKKTVNFDAPDVYHLYYGDEAGTPGRSSPSSSSPAPPRAAPGTGWSTASTGASATAAALDFWEARLAERRGGGARRRRAAVPRPRGPRERAARRRRRRRAARRRTRPDIPAEHALQGFHGVRAYAASRTQRRRC